MNRTAALATDLAEGSIYARVVFVRSSKASFKLGYFIKKYISSTISFVVSNLISASSSSHYLFHRSIKGASLRSEDRVRPLD